MEILLKLIYLPTTSMNIIEILKCLGKTWVLSKLDGKVKTNRVKIYIIKSLSRIDFISKIILIAAFCHTLYRIQRTALNRNTKDLTLSTKSWRRSIKKLSSLKQEKIDYSEDYRKGLTNLKLSLQKKQEQVNFIEDLHVLQTKWQKSLRLKSIQWRSIKKTW